ncbi:hypothetical protein FWK35_00011867 [Aphis craccivora]|uniref:Uncharacterized protein n=1 Tax=Aphis craccivora TaxID=307492 RepID=A0A6G0ZAI1_APHCR|nr:hypothetical protein FWK35_00011867 [Aphis craccivora]
MTSRGAEISCLQPPSLQSCLFSCNVNPLLHVHSYDPGVFLHSCWHPPLLTAHSSMSVKKTAANPVLCTELSDSNSTRSAFASEVIMDGAS